MAIKIQCEKKQLLKTLKQLRVVVKGKSVIALKTLCELTITDGKTTFAVPGAIFFLECKTVGTAKVTVPFIHFFEIVKSQSNPSIEIIITDGNLKVNNTTISANTCFFENDSILRTIRLPINYTDADLLKLTKQGYTEQELYFNKLGIKIEQAEKKLEDDIEFVYKLLKQYGVKISEIEALVKTNLYNSPEIN